MFQISEAIVTMGVALTFALLIAMYYVFNRATPLTGFAVDGVSSRHTSFTRVTGKRREGVNAGPPHQHQDQTPTYQRAKSILRAEQPSASHEAGVAGPLYPYVDAEELWHKEFEDEQGSASGESIQSLKGKASSHHRHRRAHSLSEDDVPLAPSPLYSTPAASVSRVSSSRTMSVAPDFTSTASRVASRSRPSTTDPEPVPEDDWDGVSTDHSLFSAAHHRLPTLPEDEPVEDVNEDLFPVSAPLPPKIPSRRRSATPDVRPAPVSSRRTRTGTEVTPASRSPTPAPTVSTQASSAAQILPSRAPSIPPSASRAPSIPPSASRAPSVAPSASRAPSAARTASRGPSMARTQSIVSSTSTSWSSLSAPSRSEVLPPRTGSSAGRHNPGKAVAISRQATPLGSASPTELAAHFPRQVYRRLQHKTKTGSMRSVGSEDKAGHEDDNQGYVVTAWFESKSDALLQSPPDLRLHPELQLGDIYYHTTGSRYQLWCWTVNSQGEPFWDEACWGYERNALFLTLTGSLQRPSWVNQRRLAAREREIGVQNDAAILIKNKVDD